MPIFATLTADDTSSSVQGFDYQVDGQEHRDLPIFIGGSLL
jgi:hypothetical protein